MTTPRKGHPLDPGLLMLAVMFGVVVLCLLYFLLF